MVAKEHWLAIATEQQLGRNRPVEGPYRIEILDGQIRMKPQGDRCRRIDAGVHAGDYARVVNSVRLCAFLGSYNADLWQKFVPALMRPYRPWGTALNGAHAATGVRRDQGRAEIL